MDHPSSFDLNTAIQHWRENLAQSPAFRSENLNELEAHLRDSISTLQSRGLDAGEAFLIATRRLGKENLLQPEFAVINGSAIWLDRLLWMLIGVQLWGAVSGVTAAVARVALALGWRQADLNGYLHINRGWAFPIAMFSLVQLLALAVSIAFCGWLVLRKGPVFGGRVGRLFLSRGPMLRLTVVAMCLLSLLMNFVGWIFPTIQGLILAPNVFQTVNFFSGYSNFLLMPIQIVTLMVMTFFLARRRFRVRQA
jgi:hypothetical protein